MADSRSNGPRPRRVVRIVHRPDQPFPWQARDVQTDEVVTSHIVEEWLRRECRERGWAIEDEQP